MGQSLASDEDEDEEESREAPEPPDEPRDSPEPLEPLEPPDPPAPLEDSLEPPEDSPEPPETPEDSDDEDAALAAAFVLLLPPRSFLAQPEPLKWIEGAENCLRIVPSAPQDGQNLGPASLIPWRMSARWSQAVQR
jgi:hypothetical protein